MLSFKSTRCRLVACLVLFIISVQLGLDSKVAASVQGGSLAIALPTDVGTGPDLTEDALMTYSLPGGSVYPGRYLHLNTTFTWGAPNTVVKESRLYFGSTVICNDGGTALGSVTFDVYVAGVGATSQKSVCTITESAGDFVNVQITLPAETASGAILIKGTGQNGSAVANQVMQRLMIIDSPN